MKKLTICFATITILFSCNQNPATVSGKKDTTLTVISYANDWQKDDYRTLTAVRVAYDTVIEKRDSSASQISIKKQQVRDTAYFVRADVGKYDTLFGKPVIDSLGKPKWKANIIWAKVNKALVIHDFK